MSTTLFPGAEPLSTLEVRWLLAGPRPCGMTAWLSRFPTTTEIREDVYLLCRESAVSVKIRGGSLLEIKMEQEDSRVLDIPGLATADVRSCNKWSFRLPADGTGMAERCGWRRVHKTRRLSRFSSGGAGIGVAPGPAPPTLIQHARGGECVVELTDIELDGRAWWTLALESTGPGNRSWDVMKTTARAVFAEPLPAPVRASYSRSNSYSDWLRALYPPTSSTAHGRTGRAVPPAGEGALLIGSGPAATAGHLGGRQAR